MVQPALENYPAAGTATTPNDGQQDHTRRTQTKHASQRNSRRRSPLKPNFGRQLHLDTLEFGIPRANCDCGAIGRF